MKSEQVVPIHGERQSRSPSTRFALGDARPHSFTDDHAADLAVLAVAAGTRFEDPRRELERVILLGSVIEAARAENIAMRAWVTHSLTEYRGSRSAWDLVNTTDALGRAFSEYLGIVTHAAERLRKLLPLASAPSDV
jgi:hypothetical protein